MNPMGPAEPEIMSQDAENVIGLQPGQSDREGAMAKADLYKIANYSHKLFKQIEDQDQMEGWVQAKITKAADYIASVYHYLEYEMKFSQYGQALEDSEVYSESQKQAIKNRLMEAKSKVKELKKVHAEKVKTDADDKIAEGILSGGHKACTECGGSGMVYEEPKAIPDHVKGKVEKYNRQAKAFHAASKRLDRNKNGIPDDEEMEEGFDSGEMRSWRRGKDYSNKEFRDMPKGEVDMKNYRDDSVTPSRFVKNKIKDMLDDVGYDGYNESFVMEHFDDDSFRVYLKDFFEEDVYNNPEVYLDDSDKELSRSQEARIVELKQMVLNLESERDSLDDEDEDYSDEYDRIGDEIDEANNEIEEIEDDPDGEYDSDKLDSIVADKISEHRYDAKEFYDNFLGGDLFSEWATSNGFIDKDDFAQAVVDADGYGRVLNNYDGSEESVSFEGETYYIFYDGDFH